MADGRSADPGERNFLAKEFVEFVVRSDPGPRITMPFLRWLSWCDQFLYRCEENGELTRDLPTARLPHHATIAVYPTAPPHVVLCPGSCKNRVKARRAALFCVAFNPAYACQKLRVAREITCDSSRAAHYLQLSLAR
jgi:hypothetical protein